MIPMNDDTTKPSAWVADVERRKGGSITAPQMIASMKTGLMIERLEIIRLVNQIPNSLDGPATKRAVIDEILKRTTPSTRRELSDGAHDGIGG